MINENKKINEVVKKISNSDKELTHLVDRQEKIKGVIENERDKESRIAQENVKLLSEKLDKLESKTIKRLIQNQSENAHHSITTVMTTQEETHSKYDKRFEGRDKDYKRSSDDSPDYRSFINELFEEREKQTETTGIRFKKKVYKTDLERDDIEDKLRDLDGKIKIRNDAKEAAKRQADKKHGFLGWRRRLTKYNVRYLKSIARLNPFQFRSSIEAHNEMLYDEIDYWKDRIKKFKSKLIVISLRFSREREIKNAERNIKEIQKIIDLNNLKAIKKETGLFSRIKDAAYRATGAETKEYQDSLNISKEEQIALKLKVKGKYGKQKDGDIFSKFLSFGANKAIDLKNITSDATQEVIRNAKMGIDLLGSNPDTITDAKFNSYKDEVIEHLKDTKQENLLEFFDVYENRTQSIKENLAKEIQKNQESDKSTAKSILNIDKQILDKLNEIEENMIDEQDTSVERVKKIETKEEPVIEKTPAAINETKEKSFIEKLLSFFGPGLMDLFMTFKGFGSSAKEILKGLFKYGFPFMSSGIGEIFSNIVSGPVEFLQSKMNAIKKFVGMESVDNDVSKDSRGSKKSKTGNLKNLGKSFIKKIPAIGAVAGGLFAAEKLTDGDAVGAGLELASGLVSIIPFVGTAASVAIDTYNASRDTSIINKLHKEGVIDKDIIGNSEINNWETIKKLEPNELKALIDYNDWSEEDSKQLQFMYEQSVLRRHLLDSKWDERDVEALSKMQNEDRLSVSKIPVWETNYNGAPLEMSKEDAEKLANAKTPEESKAIKEKILRETSLSKNENVKTKVQRLNQAEETNTLLINSTRKVQEMKMQPVIQNINNTNSSKPQEMQNDYSLFDAFNL